MGGKMWPKRNVVIMVSAHSTNIYFSNKGYRGQKQHRRRAPRGHWPSCLQPPEPHSEGLNCSDSESDRCSWLFLEWETVAANTCHSPSDPLLEDSFSSLVTPHVMLRYESFCCPPQNTLCKTTESGHRQQAPQLWDITWLAAVLGLSCLEYGTRTHIPGSWNIRLIFLLLPV